MDIQAAVQNSLDVQAKKDLADKLLGEWTKGLPAKSDPIILRWTKASIVLGGVPDPYNRESEQAAISAAQEKAKLGIASSANTDEVTRDTSQLINGILSSYGGGIFSVILNGIGDIVHAAMPSSGGYDKLQPLQRKRLQIYQLFGSQSGPTPDNDTKAMWGYHEQERNKNSFPSQHLIDLAGLTNKTDIDKAKINNYIIRMAYKAEFYRVTMTDDEAMLPTVAIAYLMQQKLWPPPLPPIPRIIFDYKSLYAPANQWRWFYYDEKFLSSDLAISVWNDLNNKYSADAKIFYDLISTILFPIDILELAYNSGCIPELGSAANRIASFGTYQDGTK